MNHRTHARDGPYRAATSSGLAPLDRNAEPGADLRCDVQDRNALLAFERWAAVADGPDFPALIQHSLERLRAAIGSDPPQLD